MLLRKSICLLLIILIVGCVKKVIPAWNTGIIPMAFIVEERTNFSSLLYDKTEVIFETFEVESYSLIPKGSKLAILPAPVITKRGGKTYNTQYSDYMKRYVTASKLGSITNSITEADFIVIISVDEGLELYFGKNTVEVSINIFDTDENPLFYTRAVMISKSDNNFYYRPSKGAKPVRYLVLKGFERIFSEAVPQAFS